MSSLVSPNPESFSTLYSHLQTLTPPLLPPGKATDPSLTDQISSLYLHPSLEAALHILNCDLPSAHFLCRHMQAAPQYEGMYLHGILHRIEGDYDNARAWYKDVSESDVFTSVWTSKDQALDLIDRVERLSKEKNVDEGEKGKLGAESLREIKGVVDSCVKKFGTEKVRDASGSWKQPESGNVKEKGLDMVSGGKGFRSF